MIGVLGGGQPGRMFTIAARRLENRVHTLSAEEETPTGRVADVERRAACDALNADRAFASRAEAVPDEFVDFGPELSVVAPRSRPGDSARFGACPKTHVRDIHDVALAPAPVAPRPGREMGHLTPLAPAAEPARERALAARRELTPVEKE